MQYTDNLQRSRLVKPSQPSQSLSASPLSCFPAPHRYPLLAREPVACTRTDHSLHVNRKVQHLLEPRKQPIVPRMRGEMQHDLRAVPCSTTGTIDSFLLIRSCMKAVNAPATAHTCSSTLMRPFCTRLQQCGCSPKNTIVHIPGLPTWSRRGQRRRWG